ncbi:aldose 1-epimerase family protein [Pontibacter cellulosilyticus]|uniref:Aldose 1-epimerase family protein n=1 Tax=Pontibacter cellulosilyticus TaxID=1720253 RepID=A0A923SNA9_9BACT|nr:aldose 1-epimerase family protein [Pontibacter cellulosilyticus]MBC5993010.1 aldose 1-epimerase family protein [Pontibacter cellulosilyticus]
MLHFLENEYFKVGIESHGAELQHFIKNDEDLEMIWVADPAVWASHAPNLFPIVGELPKQQYTYDGETYHMQRHGFARSKDFKVREESDKKLVFELEYDEETLAQYPFKFRLLVAYKLNDNRLEVTYNVFNEDKKAMWFSVGAHPGFNVPLYPNEQYEDYYLEFEQEETLRRYLIDENGLQTGETELIEEQSNILPLRHQYFDKDAIILKDLNSERLVLASHTGPRKIEVEFQGFPYLGIWAKPGPSPYVCIEPWCGIASSTNGSGELQDKEGINELGPKQVFERTLSIRVW